MDHSISQVREMVRTHEIRWSDPTPSRPRREDIDPVDLFGLNYADLAMFAYDTLAELRTVRGLLSAALTLVAKQSNTLARSTRIIQHQRDQIRTGGAPGVAA